MEINLLPTPSKLSLLQHFCYFIDSRACPATGLSLLFYHYERKTVSDWSEA